MRLKLKNSLHIYNNQHKNLRLFSPLCSRSLKIEIDVEAIWLFFIICDSLMDINAIEFLSLLMPKAFTKNSFIFTTQNRELFIMAIFLQTLLCCAHIVAYHGIRKNFWFHSNEANDLRKVFRKYEFFISSQLLFRRTFLPLTKRWCMCDVHKMTRSFSKSFSLPSPYWEM